MSSQIAITLAVLISVWDWVSKPFVSSPSDSILILRTTLFDAMKWFFVLTILVENHKKKKKASDLP